MSFRSFAALLSDERKNGILVDLFRRGVAAGDNYCKNRLALILADRGHLEDAERLSREAIATISGSPKQFALFSGTATSDNAEALFRAAARMMT